MTTTANANTNTNDDKNIKSHIGYAFIETLEDLGETGKMAIVSNLQRRGIFLSDSRITLSLLYDILIELLGEEATEIIMERVIIELDKIYHDEKSNRSKSSLT